MMHYIKLTKYYVSRVVGKTKGYRIKLKDDLLMIREGLSQEGKNNKEMLQIYQRFTLNKASKEDMAVANKQFVEFLKSLGLGVIVVLPFSPITIPLIVKLGKKYGIEVIPNSFSKKDSGDNTGKELEETDSSKPAS